MDNYSLKDVKNLVDNNLITKDILENILQSATRRLELYNDMDDFQILKYLLKCKIISNDTKDEINKYLKEYESLVIKKEKEYKKNRKARLKNIAILLCSIIIMIIICLLLWNKR